jgi:hypothetical protein
LKAGIPASFLPYRRIERILAIPFCLKANQATVYPKKESSRDANEKTLVGQHQGVALRQLA